MKKKPASFAARCLAAALATSTVMPPSAEAQGYAPPQPIEARYSAQGPWTVEVDRSAGCCDSKGNAFDVYRPADLGMPGVRHPVITWGNGTFATPEQYDFVLMHFASWGFVIVATRDSSTASGLTMRDALQFIRDQANLAGSPYYDHIDITHVAAVGHSQGAGGAMNALIDAQGSIQTAIAIDLPSQRFCSGDDCARVPFGMPANTSVFFASGTADHLSPPIQQGPTSPPLQSLQAYYDAVPSGLLKVKASLIGAAHNDIQGQPACRFLTFGCNIGSEGYLGYLTVWLTWQLDQDPAGVEVFRQNSGEIFRASQRWTSVSSSAP